MKKIFIFITFLFILISSTYACKIRILEKEIPDNFNINCYEKTWELIIEDDWFDELWNIKYCNWQDTIKINSPKIIDTFVSWRWIIPHKLYKSTWKNINYEINLNWNIKNLKDNNNKTFLIYDTTKDNEIIIKLDESLKADMFDFSFIFESNNFVAKYERSVDWIKYYSTKKGNIQKFNTKFVKIKFNSRTKNITHEKIKIKELSFKTNNYEYLIKTLWWKLTAYSNNMCVNNNPYLWNNPSKFDFDKNTKNIDLVLENNLNFNTTLNKDKDKDWIIDSKDNCINIENPLQKDTTWNWIWDLCSDDDKDWFIWKKDNCPYLYNPKQVDININNVWDLCEFDKDLDWIFDHLDNCINTKNPNQSDNDSDWIGNKCDNCERFNPKQIDLNKDWIWDICTDFDNYLNKNDTDKDWILNKDDNCKNIANSQQKDLDNDWIWDVCDNCKSIQNKDQLDFNKNSVWDICEDSDNDWVEWINDNCINIHNPKQIDSNNNGIWDLCEDSDNDNIVAVKDNCPNIYNPEQSDTDSDNIWDKCDSKDNRYIESNKNLFIGLLVLIALVFSFWIYRMVKQLK